MTDSTTNAETIVPGSGLGALVTTGLVSAIAAFSATLLYFHYFPPVVEKPAPIAVVDMVKLGTKMSGEGDASAFMNTGRAIAMLKEYGYIVLDSRMVITAPDVYMKKPSDLIEGAPDLDNTPSGYTPPNLLKGVKGDAQQH